MKTSSSSYSIERRRRRSFYKTIFKHVFSFNSWCAAQYTWSEEEGWVEKKWSTSHTRTSEINSVVIRRYTLNYFSSSTDRKASQMPLTKASAAAFFPSTFKFFLAATVSVFDSKSDQALFSEGDKALKAVGIIWDIELKYKHGLRYVQMLNPGIDF